MEVNLRRAYLCLLLRLLRLGALVCPNLQEVFCKLLFFRLLFFRLLFLRLPILVLLFFARPAKARSCMVSKSSRTRGGVGRADLRHILAMLLDGFSFAYRSAPTTARQNS